MYVIQEPVSSNMACLTVLIKAEKYILTLVLLNPDVPCFANSVDPDQLASEEAN